MPKGKTDTIRVIITTDEFAELEKDGRVFNHQRITRGNLEKFKDGHLGLSRVPNNKLMILCVL